MGIFAKMFGKSPTSTELSGNEQLRNGCILVKNFWDVWLKKSGKSVLDPNTKEFMQLSPAEQRSMTLMSFSILYGAAMQSGHFSSKPRKRVEEFAFLLNKKLKMPSQTAIEMARMMESEKNHPSIKNGIPIGEKAFDVWMRDRQGQLLNFSD